MPRIRFSIEERTEIVREYQDGSSLRTLAKKYDTGHMTIHRIVEQAGALRDRSGLYPKKQPAFTVAQIVRVIRSQMGWTQTELGKRIDVGRAQVSNIEAGRHELPASKLLLLLNEANWTVAPPKY